MKDSANIIFFGDIVGRPGREVVSDYILENNLSDSFIIANVENASHGFGLTEKNYDELSAVGIDAMTSGNHIWDKKEIFSYMDKAEKLVRPLNYTKNTLGSGVKFFEKNGVVYCVMNLLGKVFMDSPASAWNIIEKEIEQAKEITPVIIIDFHAEATAEKVAFGRYCSELGATCVFGTHTHIQTADEQILNQKTAYITDVGSSGASDGVIGMGYSESLKRMLTGLPERFDVAEGLIRQINAVSVEIDTSLGIALNIKRINIVKSCNEVE